MIEFPSTYKMEGKLPKLALYRWEEIRTGFVMIAKSFKEISEYRERYNKINSLLNKDGE